MTLREDAQRGKGGTASGSGVPSRAREAGDNATGGHVRSHTRRGDPRSVPAWDHRAELLDSRCIGSSPACERRAGCPMRIFEPGAGSLVARATGPPDAARGPTRGSRPRGNCRAGGCRLGVGTSDDQSVGPPSLQGEAILGPAALRGRRRVLLPCAPGPANAAGAGGLVAGGHCACRVGRLVAGRSGYLARSLRGAGDAEALRLVPEGGAGMGTKRPVAFQHDRDRASIVGTLVA